MLSVWDRFSQTEEILKLLVGSLNSIKLLIRSLGLDVLVTLFSRAYNRYGSITCLGDSLLEILPLVLMEEVRIFCGMGMVASKEEAERVFWPVVRSLSDMADTLGDADDGRLDDYLRVDLSLLLEQLLLGVNACIVNIKFYCEGRGGKGEAKAFGKKMGGSLTNNLLDTPGAKDLFFLHKVSPLSSPLLSRHTTHTTPAPTPTNKQTQSIMVGGASTASQIDTLETAICLVTNIKRCVASHAQYREFFALFHAKLATMLVERLIKLFKMNEGRNCYKHLAEELFRLTTGTGGRPVILGKKRGEVINAELVAKKDIKREIRLLKKMLPRKVSKLIKFSF